MKRAIWNFIVDLIIILLDGAFIALCATNAYWWGMAVAIIFVPYSANELSYSYYTLLKELLNYFSSHPQE